MGKEKASRNKTMEGAGRVLEFCLRESWSFSDESEVGTVVLASIILLD